ncbi:MAG TPA: cupin domain-containing protein [Phycisphaerae bacterium]|nr:cupin domain-containing protein [Phycisphaerae bacterium]
MKLEPSTTPPADPGPENPDLQRQNRSSFNPPRSDEGDVKNFRYPFAFSHNRVTPDAGWARQVTVRDMPIATTVAGVNMRLEKGAIRELHWHIPAEWAYIITGRVRITGVDFEGRAFVDDLGPGDLWYFPAGIPHSIQAISDDGSEFLLAFDDGAFSEFDTFLITDWFNHIPRDVLVQNLGWPPSAFDKLPPEELYIFAAKTPGSLEDDKKAAIGPQGEVPCPFSHRLLAQPPDRRTPSGEVHIADSRNFKASITIAVAHVCVRPGAMRELHWHPNADEWQYYIAGNARMTVFEGGAKARTIDFHPGDVGYIQKSLPHYIQNTGDSDLEFLEIFKADKYQDVSLNQWLSHLPPQLVESHLNIPPGLVQKLPKEKQVIIPPNGPAK